MPPGWGADGARAAGEHDRPILVLISGAHRVDEARLSAAVGARIEQAPATWVKQGTGFAVGGVPPLGHTAALVTFMDEGLLRHELVRAAAGTPHGVFPIAPGALRTATDATTASPTA